MRRVATNAFSCPDESAASNEINPERPKTHGKCRISLELRSTSAVAFLSNGSPAASQTAPTISTRKSNATPPHSSALNAPSKEVNDYEAQLSENSAFLQKPFRFATRLEQLKLIRRKA